MKEIWKDIPRYEGLYQVSTLGRVKSLKYKKDRILKQSINKAGYLVLNLTINSKSKINYIHKLIAITFLNHKPNRNKLVIDHKDNNPLNNLLNNIQIVTHRENCSKDRSGLVGASYCKLSKKWMSQIQINKIDIYLGRFETELQAHEVYQSKLRESK